MNRINSKYSISIILFLGLCNFAFSQGQSLFDFNPEIKVIENGRALKNPFAGGLNFVQIEEYDFNNDGLNDLFVFDRSGNKVLPFITTETENGIDYIYDATYIEYFPPISNWIKIIDYNCDGKKDIFTYNPLGIEVWENTSSSGEIEFKKLSFTYNTINGPKEIEAIKTDTGGDYDVNLSIIYQDIPAIVDIDGDGALDILNFGLGSAIPEGSTIEYHRNRSKCGLDFVKESNCWGGFAENYTNNSVTLNVCGETNNLKKNIQMHAGSSLLLHDFSGNGLLDILIGDITFENATMVYNQGTAENAQMLDLDDNYPSYSTPIDLEYFPGFSLIDIGLDGKLDLIASPAIKGSENKNSIWRYEDNSLDSQSKFELQTKGFLQDEMIDHGEASKPSIVDINGDGKNDILISNYGVYQKGGTYKSSIAYYKNNSVNGNLFFELQTDDFEALSKYNWLNIYPAFGDLNNDGYPDMILGEQQGLIHYFESSSEGKFEIKQFNYLGLDVGNSAMPLLYDIDNDGLLDLIVGNKRGNLNLLLNKGDKNEANFELESTSWGNVDLSSIDVQGAWLSADIIEKNNEKILLLGTQIGKVYAYIISNKEDFEIISEDYFDFDDGERTTVAIGDLNSNGLNDILIGNMNGGLRIGLNKSNLSEGKKEFTVYPNPLSISNEFKIIGINNYENISVKINDIKGRAIPFKIENDKIKITKTRAGIFIIVLDGEINGKAKFIIKK